MNQYVTFIQKGLGPLFRLFYPMEIIGRENLPETAMLCPNHSSGLDVPMIVIAFPVGYKVQAMGKESLFKIPFIGWYLKKAGAFPVKRGENDINAIKKSIYALKNGFSMVVFPEGTRVDTPGEVEAKGGGVMIAIRTGVPLVPVYIEHKKRLFRKSRVIFGEPFKPVYTGRNGTADEIQANADEALRRAYALGGISI